MAVNNDAEIFNDCGDQGDWTGGTLGDTSGFDPPTNNTTGSDVELYREGTTAQQWVMKENQTAEYTYTNQINNGAGGSRDITGGRVVIFWRWIASDADLDKLTLHRLRLSSDTGFTTNNAEWDVNARIYALDFYGWFPCPVYPTNPDATTGTIVYTSVDSIGWVATTGGTGTKVTGFDQCLSISFLGGDSASFTYEDLYDESVLQDYGVAFKDGENYKFWVNINVGLAGQTANSILNQANKSLYFDNIEPEHNLGYVIINGTSNESHLILDSVVHTWNEQDGTSPQIFTDPENADQFKIDNCTFINGGELDSPPDTANRWIRNCKFDNIGATTISDGEVSDTTISNSPAVTVSGDADLTGSSILTSTVAADASALVWNGNFDPDGNLDDMVFSKGTAAHHAIELGIASPTTIGLRGIDFQGFNALDGQNDSTIHVKRTSGTVTINLFDVSGNVSYKSDGATVEINATYTHSLTGMVPDTEVHYFPAGQEGSGELFHVESVDSSGLTAYVYNYGGSDTFVDIYIFHVNYDPIYLFNVTLTNADASIPINQGFDRVYSNP